MFWISNQVGNDMIDGFGSLMLSRFVSGLKLLKLKKSLRLRYPEGLFIVETAIDVIPAKAGI